MKYNPCLRLPVRGTQTGRSRGRQAASRRKKLRLLKTMARVNPIFR